MGSNGPILIGTTQVGPIAYDMVELTWVPDPPSQEEAFGALRAALQGDSNFWNASESFGTPERNSNHLLNEYFTKYPEDADKVVLSVKGGMVPGQPKVDGSEQNIRRSVEDSRKALGGKKMIDIFECARVDPNVPIEEQMLTMMTLIDEGKIGGIGLSGCSAATIRRAAAVGPVAVVEVELSLVSTDILYNGIAETCAELGIPIVAFEALGRGTLTEPIGRKYSKIPKHDGRKHLLKVQDDVLEHENQLVEEIQSLAKGKDCTMPQLAVSWILTLSNYMLPNGLKLGTIIPLPGASSVPRVHETLRIVSLTDEEMSEIWTILDKHSIKGA